ncbi:MAG: sulfur oxidation c-type cytochrome SoxA [Betaproteobacteria bacterium]|nr:MAG: sulfur oxidation c-type cytochrome SoxA [Betaproteobacteria bacterium]
MVPDLGRWSAALSTILLLGAAPAPETPPHHPAKSGIDYASDDVRRMQADDFANPGMLWVAQGGKRWQEPAGNSGKSCAACHGDAAKAMKGVAARYPGVDAATSELLNLEGRINRCRKDQQAAEPLAYESEDLLALTAYVAHQSRGQPLQVSVDAAARPYFARGREIYYRRQGQMNLACTHCHEQNVGRKLLADTISEGHGNAYPIYRLEWQSAGSLHRRLRACYFGVRAEMPAAGSAELLDLELYLAWRARGLPVETPGVRR